VLNPRSPLPTLSAAVNAPRGGSPLTGYRLRTVRIGVLTTVLALACLVVFPMLPGHPPIDRGPYLALMLLAVAGAIVVWALPWQRMFERGIGLWALYAWSVLDIALVSAAIGISGGGRSEVWIMYGLTTLFFAASYPVLGQIVLLGVTVASYAAVVTATGWHLSPAAFFIRISGIALVLFLASFLSRELMRQMVAHSESREESERRARALESVTASARQMSMLDPDKVLGVVIDAVIDLGFDAASLCEFDDDLTTYRVMSPRGLPEGFARRVHAASEGMPGMVLTTGGTVAVDDYPDRPGAIPALVAAGFRSVVGSPIWSEGTLAAVLVGGSSGVTPLRTEDVEAFELLAAQAGPALQNARRFDRERHTVERMAEVDRMKSDFLATVSHEVRTPVTIIEGLGLTMQRDWDRLDEDTRREFMDRLASNARALHGIIETLLDFSRLDAGRLTLNPERIDLGELAATVAGRMAELLADHVVTVTTEPGLDVDADPDLIDRVVENLLLNAVKHTPAGTQIDLRVMADDDEVVLMVADRGPGIPEHEVGHLGERFFRGGETNTRGTGGLGLGLALVVETLELHGTRLEVESRVGRGASFRFRLPLARPDAHARSSSRTEERSASPS
jgi:signal transduction histidine kinase